MLRRNFLAGVGAALVLPAFALPAPRTSGVRLAAAARRQLGVTTGYDPNYARMAYPGGDVPQSTGVCADVVIRAAREGLGLDLQQLVHDDMARNFGAYPTTWHLEHPDRNIDHRRVLNLEAYWRRQGAQLWAAKDGSGGNDFPVEAQVGDELTWLLGGKLPHVGIVVSTGIAGPRVVHNIGGGVEEWALFLVSRTTCEGPFPLALGLGGEAVSYNRMIVTLDFLGNLQRTQMCGELRASDAGSEAVVMGWVNRRRDHGNLIFLDIRDRSGITQVVFDKELSPAAHARAEAARSEYVVAATGTVRRRDAELVNAGMATGEIEVAATSLLLLNDAKTPPFSPAEDAIVNEEVRLKYRYLDLRRAGMQHNFRLRHEVARAIRNYLSDAGFLEIETPFMTRSTPEGARDYLVPSRVHPGEFYALPQSPQIFKQILMVSGFDKYFQIARCFRDEDLRADRQPEFTQIDLEMTFPQQELIFKTVEGFLTAAFKTAGIALATPFVHMTYDEAIRNYGIDKPDMRLPAMVELGDVVTPQLRESLKIEQALPILGFLIPQAGEMSGTQKRSMIDEIRKFLGDCGLDFLDVARLKTNADFAMLAEGIQNRFADATGDEGASLRTRLRA